ncbi:MAG: LacI family DNA-binding transcriptional regulator [Leucobacter sp.]
MVTSRDVARLAGVSQATVSRALSQPDKVSSSSRAKVTAAMDELGYVPHAAAQAMKTRRTNTIGVVVSDLMNPFYNELLDELTSELASAQQRVLLWNAGHNSLDSATQALRERAVDGVLFTSVTTGSLEFEEAFRGGFPIVLLNRVLEGFDGDTVTSDNTAGGELVADYLVAHGKTDVAVVTGTDAATTARVREQSFKARMVELGYPVPEHRRINARFDHDLAQVKCERLLEQAKPPQAIFCCNDVMGFGALDALRAKTLTAEDCWVIGYDDVEMSSWPTINLTTVRQPARLMAREGVAMLLRRIRDGELPGQRKEFAPELFVRASTAFAPAPVA